MATKKENTPTKGAVVIVASTNQMLEYRLKVSGARANFAWVDDKATTVLTHLDFGMIDELVWQLKTGVDNNGQIILTAPPNATYSRTESSPASTAYTLTLLFVTALGYTLTIKLLDSAGKVIDTLADIAYTDGQRTDIEDTSLIVNLTT